MLKSNNPPMPDGRDSNLKAKTNSNCWYILLERSYFAAGESGYNRPEGAR